MDAPYSTDCNSMYCGECHTARGHYRSSRLVNCFNNNLQSLEQACHKYDDESSYRSDLLGCGIQTEGFYPDTSLSIYGPETEGRYSRKVFVGGLPPDISVDEITSTFREFGPLTVDWPHKVISKSYFPPRGYSFLLFEGAGSVVSLIEACVKHEDKLYFPVSSPTVKDKPVQIRPWRLSDADCILDDSSPLDPRKTIFVGGVPRQLKAAELATVMERLFGGVSYAGIETDPSFKYPKGAGRVAFTTQESYIAAMSTRYVRLECPELDKRVEVKPYVLDNQLCDECQGRHNGGKFASLFCTNLSCLRYYCEYCWITIHSGRETGSHRRLFREGLVENSERPGKFSFDLC